MGCRSLIAALLVGSFPAWAQLVSRAPEQRLAWPPADYNAEGFNVTPAAAATAAGFLIVWASTRATEPSQVYATRLTLAGARVDRRSSPLAPANRRQARPAIAAAPGLFLVAWEEGDEPQADIVGVRVRDDGVVLDATPLVIAADADAQQEPTIAFDGASFLVAWTHRVGNGAADLRGARVSAATGLVTTAFDIASSGADESSPSAAWDGTRWIVAYLTAAGSGDVFAQRLEPLGAPTEAALPVEVATTAARTPSVAATGGRWAVAWQRTATPNAVVLARATAAVVEAPVVLGNTRSQSSPHVLVDPGGLSVTYHQVTDGFLTQAIPPSGPLGVPSSGYSLLNADTDIAVAVAPGGQRFVTEVIPASSGFDSLLLGALIGGIDQVQVSTSSSVMIGVKLLPRGDAAAAVWRERVLTWDTWSAIRAQLLDRKGRPLADAGDLYPWSIGTGDPSVASNGRTSVIAWATWTSLFAAPWPAGDVGVLDAGLMNLSPGPRVLGGPGLAAAPDAGFLVVWSDDRAQASQPDLYYSRLTADGAPLDLPGLPLRVGPGGSRHAVAAFNGQDFVVAFTEGSPGSLEVASISTAGALMAGPRRVTAVGVVTPSFSSGAPGEALLLWSAPTDAGLDVFAARAFADGGWPDDAGVRLLDWAGDQLRARASWVGTRYVIAFDSGDTTPRRIALGELDFDQRPPFAPAPGASWSAATDLTATDIAALPSGEVLTAGTHFSLAPPEVQSTRGFVALSGWLLPDGAECTEAVVCVSMRCEAGRCCTSCGAPDAGIDDAGLDAGLGMDAGPGEAGVDGGLDAGPPSDAGLDEPRRHGVGCGCGTSGASPLLLLAFAWWLGRRRAAAPPADFQSRNTMRQVVVVSE